MSQTISRATFEDFPVPHILHTPKKVRSVVDQLGQMFRHVLKACPGGGLFPSSCSPGGLWYLSAAPSMTVPLSNIPTHPSCLGAMVTHHAVGLWSTSLGVLL